MGLATGSIILRQSVITCVMTRIVIERVELLATQKGYKSLKTFNRKNRKLMLSNADLLEVVGDENMFVDKEIFGGESPLEDEEWNDVPDPVEDNNLDVDDKIDQSKLADLLGDSRISFQLEEIQQEVEEDKNEVVHGDDERHSNEPSICELEGGSVGYEIPDLASDEEGRPMRSVQAPEMYDPSTGESDVQSRLCEVNYA